MKLLFPKKFIHLLLLIIGWYLLICLGTAVFGLENGNWRIDVVVLSLLFFPSLIWIMIYVFNLFKKSN